MQLSGQGDVWPAPFGFLGGVGGCDVDGRSWHIHGQAVVEGDYQARTTRPPYLHDDEAVGSAGRLQQIVPGFPVGPLSFCEQGLQVHHDRLLGTARNHHDGFIVRIGVLLPMRNVWGHVDVVPRACLHPLFARPALGLLGVDEFGVSADNVDRRLRLTMMVIAGGSPWGNAGLPHPDPARTREFPADRGESPHASAALRGTTVELAGPDVANTRPRRHPRSG